MKKLVFLFGVFLVFASFIKGPNSINKPAFKPPAKDTIPLRNKKVLVYSTVSGTDKRLSQEVSLAFSYMGQPKETQPCVFVDPSKTFQTFMGIGGALTDAAAETFAKLPKDKQEELLRAYYDREKGIGYTLGRTNIHSCDFSSGSYTYVKENDKSLASFSVDHDRKYRIPLLKKSLPQPVDAFNCLPVPGARLPG